MKQVTFSSYGQTTSKDEADESRTADATSRENECFGPCIVFETSDDEGASMRKSCVIEGDKECEADMIEEVATRNDIESEVAMDKSTVDDRVETFPTLDLETWAVASKCQHETQETESGGEEKIEANANNNVEAKMDIVGKHVLPDGRCREPAHHRIGPDRFRPIGRTEM